MRVLGCAAATASLAIVIFALRSRDAPASSSATEMAVVSPGAAMIPEPLPPHLDRWRDARWRPTAAEIGEIPEEELPILGAAYRSASNLASVRGLTWTLAVRGGVDAGDALRRKLSEDRGGARLAREEEVVLWSTPLALGLVAASDDASYDFLKRAVDPTFWNQRHTWTSDVGAHSASILVSFSIQGLGVSGRDDAAQVIEGLREREAAYVHRFAGDIVQAAYYHDTRRSRGKAWLEEHLLRSSQCAEFTDFEEWTRTPRGSAWLAWGRASSRGPIPRS